jgi:hypothetical protein
MVPTEEERLPVRVSVSVRGLNALLFAIMLFAIPHHLLPLMSHSFFSHPHHNGHCFMPKFKRTLSLPDNFLLIEFLLLRSTYFV